MTVAIAAICGGNSPMIVCAEDHMITAGDVEFEQPQPKIRRLAPACIAMIYGDSAAQTELATMTEAAVRADRLSDVRAMAFRYAYHMRGYIRHQAENAILSPLNLTVASLTRQQPAIDANLSARLVDQMQEFYTDSGLGQTLGGAIIASCRHVRCVRRKLDHYRSTNRVDMSLDFE